jgi:hypothetical protein
MDNVQHNFGVITQLLPQTFRQLKEMTCSSQSHSNTAETSAVSIASQNLKLTVKYKESPSRSDTYQCFFLPPYIYQRDECKSKSCRKNVF